MAPVEAAVRALIAGPTQVEAAAGLASSIPAGVSINSLSISSGAVEVDLSSRVLSGLDESALQNIFDQFRATIGDFPNVTTIKLTSGGRLLSSYLSAAPQVAAAEPRAVATSSEPATSGVGLSGKKICVGPSHGRYWVGWWGWQRSDPCGFGEAVLEDTNSVRLVQFLKQYLVQDGATFTAPRQLDESDCCNSDTGLPWWKMCASTWLHHAGAPGSVWASYSGNTGADTATDRSSDDIRARPLYADSQAADIYIAHHTNAGGGGTATGTETYRDTAMEHPEYVTASYNLATAVQNSVVSTIRSTFPEEPSWSNRGVKDSAGGFGEIRIPSRPAILIELAFHDDCSRDASYLTDDFFRSVAEWGIYNGICSYFGNTPTWDKYSCELVGDTIPSTMQPGQSYNVSVTYRNRGVCWFTSRGFRLGAVGDSDPFASFTRVDISGEVKPGGLYTFNFTLKAPSSTGTYTTEWQMVRDGYAWFGPVISKSIAVSDSPVDPPENHGTAIAGYTFDWQSNPTSASAWATNTCTGGISQWYTYGVPITGKTCTVYDRNLYWNSARSYSGRGHFNTDVQVTCSGTATAKYVLLNGSNGDTGTQPTLNQCPLNGWYNILNSDWTDLSTNGWRTNPNIADWGSGCNTNKTCGSTVLAAAGLHMYAARWQYIDDWTCLGGYSSSSVSDTANRNFAWGESGLYLYPAVDTSHGNVIAAGLGLNGKIPGRVSTGDCNSANSLNFKGNANAYGGGDNMDSYGFAWVYTPSGAGPKFLIGSDDGNRVWVNGSLINDNNAARGLTRDQDETGGVGLAAGWNRVLFKVHNGTGGFEGAISLRNGGDKRWNEPSVNVFNMGSYSSYGLGYEQDAWYPHFDLANVNGVSSPQPGSQVFTNNTTVTASGTAWSSGPVPLWKQMHYEWGYGLSGDTSYTDVTTSTSTDNGSWSNTTTGVTGHRRFHFFAVSKSGRTSFQDSGSTGGSKWQDGGYGNYVDVFVDNLPPQNPSFASVTSAAPDEMSLAWDVPLDQGVGIGAGADESYDATSAASSNHYRAGNVGVQIRRDGTPISGWTSAVVATDTGLQSNTEYSYDIAARDNTGQTRGAWNNTTAYVGATARYTLAKEPTIGLNIATTALAGGHYTPAGWPGFTNPQGFGINGKVSSFRYKWSTNPSDEIVEAEGTAWTAGAMTTPPGSDGSYYLYVRSYNAEGVGYGSTVLGPYVFESDAVAPTLEVTVDDDSKGTTGNFLKGSLTADITATDNEGGSGLAKVELKLDDGDYSELTGAAGSYTWTDTIDASWTNGPHSITVKATDNASNAAVVTKNFTVNKNEVSGFIGLQGLTNAPLSRSVVFVLNGTTVNTVSLSFYNGVSVYTLTDVPDMTSISAKTAWSLRKLVSGLSADDGQYVADFIGSTVVPGGDLNGDNVINAIDYSLLRGAWGLGIAGDINGDGYTDNADYLIMKANWYKKGDAQ